MSYDTEFMMVTFDGWSSCRNKSVLGFIVNCLRSEQILESRCIGDVEIKERHGPRDVCNVIAKIVPPVNKSAF